MNSDPTAFDRVPGARPVTASTSICEARAHLHRTGEAAAVVYRQGRPIGVVTAVALTRASTAGHANLPIATVMDYVAVPLDRNADTLDIIRSLDNAAWDWLKRRPGATSR
jgi:CBS domain-containing protein